MVSLEDLISSGLPLRYQEWFQDMGISDLNQAWEVSSDGAWMFWWATRCGYSKPLVEKALQLCLEQSLAACPPEIIPQERLTLALESLRLPLTNSQSLAFEFLAQFLDFNEKSKAPGGEIFVFPASFALACSWAARTQNLGLHGTAHLVARYAYCGGANTAKIAREVFKSPSEFAFPKPI